MISPLAAVLLCSLAAAASAAPAPAPVVKASTAAAAAPAASAALGVSTLTVSSLYTGDRVRDPFMPASAGGPARVRDKNVPLVVDIHALQLRGILQDSSSAFALFKAEDGGTLVLRGGDLFDDSNKRVPGIHGRIQIKQKRAELITEDKDVQVYTLGETGDEDKDKASKP